MHVRVCVDCGEEYRPEIAVCADCGGRLEDRHLDEGLGVLPATSSAVSAAHPDQAFTEAVLHAEQAAELIEAADHLVEEGVACRVRQAQAPRQTSFPLRDDDGRGDAALGPGAGYWLMVAAADRDRALAVLGVPAADAASAGGEGAGESRSCPACGATVPSRVVDCPECGLAVGDEPD